MKNIITRKTVKLSVQFFIVDNCTEHYTQKYKL